MPRYFVQSDVIHDQQPFKAGQPITLTEEQAKPLLRVHAIITEADAKQADVIKQEVKQQEGQLKQKDAEIQALREEVEKMKAGLVPAPESPAAQPTK